LRLRQWLQQRPQQRHNQRDPKISKELRHFVAMLARPRRVCKQSPRSARATRRSRWPSSGQTEPPHTPSHRQSCAHLRELAVLGTAAATETQEANWCVSLRWVHCYCWGMTSPTHTSSLSEREVSAFLTSLSVCLSPLNTRRVIRLAHARSHPPRLLREGSFPHPGGVVPGHELPLSHLALRLLQLL
jgi:hypothetical protein